MEFNKKLQELRNKKGLTQEELGKILFVSRTAISKWESGRGYPNLDSLKDIAKFFSVTVDELLNSEELLTVAQIDNKRKENRLKTLFFGTLDISVLMLLFLPFFNQKIDGAIFEVSLLRLTKISLYVKISYFIIVLGIALLGIFTLATLNCKRDFWVKNKYKISLILNALGVIIFIISLQPYATVLIFIFLVIKALILIKW